MASPTDPLEQLRISKNAYFFNLRRRYTPVARYTTKKSSSGPLEKLVGARAPPPKLPERPGGRAAPEAAKTASGGPSFLGAIFKTMILFFVVAMVALAGLMLWISQTTPKYIPTPAGPVSGFAGGLELSPVHLDMISAGTREDPGAQPYAQFDYSGRNLSAWSVDARIYASAPSRQVFLLQYPRIGDSTWTAFRSALEAELHERGWPLAEIRIEDLDSLPGGSTLIIPTGFMPQALLDGSDAHVPSAMQLAQRGVSVVYIGQSLDRMLDAQGRPTPTPAEALARTGLTFNSAARPSSSAPYHMGAALYSVASKRYLIDLYYGSVSGAGVGSGFLLFVPQTLEGGWPQDGAGAARDIAMLVAEEPYRPVLASSRLSVAGSPASGGRTSLFFEPAIEAQDGVLRLRFYLNDSAGQTEQLVVDWPIGKASSGEMYMAGGNILVPRYLGGSEKYIELNPGDPSGRAMNLYLELEHDGQTFGRTAVGNGPIYTNIPTTTTFGADVPTGAYVLRLVDSANRIYAATRVWVPQLEVVGPAAIGTWRSRGINYNNQLAFATGDFKFLFVSDGQPRAVPAVSVSMSGPTAALNGPTQTFNGQEVIDYQFKRDFVRGNYTFVFDFGRGYTRNTTLTYWYRLQPWERSDVLILGAISAIIFGFGFYVSKIRGEKQLYSLDIPDFPPQSVLKIKLAPSQVLALFEQINRDYAWERMPLKPEEIRNGFRKINTSGRQVMIGDYNLTRILEQMRERRLVVEELGYWMPAAWVRAGAPGTPQPDGSPQTPKRLAMFRSLRDLFVTYAIRFSKLQALPNCDVKAIAGSSEYYLHFFDENPAVIVRALTSCEAGMTWILFKDSDERDRFEESLHSAATAPLALKLQIANRRVRLVTLEELPTILKNLKMG